MSVEHSIKVRKNFISAKWSKRPSQEALREWIVLIDEESKDSNSSIRKVRKARPEHFKK